MHEYVTLKSFDGLFIIRTENVVFHKNKSLEIWILKNSIVAIFAEAAVKQIPEVCKTNI